jgi:hypothetical protein
MVRGELPAGTPGEGATVTDAEGRTFLVNMAVHEVPDEDGAHFVQIELPTTLDAVKEIELHTTQFASAAGAANTAGLRAIDVSAVKPLDL